MRSTLICCLCVIATAVLATNAALWAAPIAIANPDFLTYDSDNRSNLVPTPGPTQGWWNGGTMLSESGGFTQALAYTPGFSVPARGYVPGWLLGAYPIQSTSTMNLPFAFNGNTFTWLSAMKNPGPSGFLYQTLSDTLQADTVYTLSMYVAHRSDYPYFAPDVSLLAGSTSLPLTPGAGNADPGAGNYNTWTWTYTAGATPPSGLLQIRIGEPPGSGVQTNVSHVQLDGSPIPEPSTLALLGLGVIGLLVYACRRRA